MTNTIKRPLRIERENREYYLVSADNIGVALCWRKHEAEEIICALNAQPEAVGGSSKISTDVGRSPGCERVSQAAERPQGQGTTPGGPTCDAGVKITCEPCSVCGATMDDECQGYPMADEGAKRPEFGEPEHPAVSDEASSAAGDWAMRAASDITLLTWADGIHPGEKRIAAIIRRHADAEIARLRKLLYQHHHHHLDAGNIGLPDGTGGWVEIDNADAYSESKLYEETVQALEGLRVEHEVEPRGALKANWWAASLMERRKRRAAEKEIARLQARIKELEGKWPTYAARMIRAEALEKWPPRTRASEARVRELEDVLIKIDAAFHDQAMGHGHFRTYVYRIADAALARKEPSNG